MTFVRRRVSAARGRVAACAVRALVAAVLAPGLLAGGLLAGTGTAAAAEPPRQGGAAATLDGLRTYGQAVVHKDGGDVTIGAGLFQMTVDGGGTLQTYCTDIDNPTQEEARYKEVPWSTTSLHDNPDAGKIRWILQHSYPRVNDLRALARASGARRLTPQTAAAGTQVAIWRFSEKAGGPDGARVDAVDPAAEKLADHLQRKARRASEPRASLTLGPAALAGKTGDRAGPVTVRTTASSVAIAPAPDAASRGVRVVDADGKPVTSAHDGSKLYFRLPQGGRAGTTSLTAQAATKVPVGRAFTGVGEHARSQTQILAGSSQATVSATATVRWAESGAIPAATAEKNCAEGGVDVTVENAGDEPFRFAPAGKAVEVPPGGTRTVTVPVREDQPYRISLPGPGESGGSATSAEAGGPGGPGATFTGVLDCATASAAGPREEAGGGPQAEPATVGGDQAVTSGTGEGTDLAQTGADNTPVIMGIALTLVVVGTLAMVAVRRRAPEHDAGQDQGQEQERAPRREQQPEAGERAEDDPGE